MTAASSSSETAFVALVGSQSDGHDHIAKAVTAGARVIFCERLPDSLPAAPQPLSLVLLKDTRQALAQLTELAYGRPSDELKVIGITGTNGKTTTSYLLESLGTSLGKKVGVLGTVSHRYPGYEEPSINTTPGVVRLKRLLRQMVDAGVDWVVMEVSSHGLEQGRLAGVSFDIGAWTNLSPDHLDFHGTMEQYSAAKAKLFNTLLPRSQKRTAALFNGQSEAIGRALDFASAPWGETLWFGLDEAPLPKGRQLRARGIRESRTGWRGELVLDDQIAAFELPLVGRYNVENALVAVGIAAELGAPLSAIATALKDIAQVPGRMERVVAPQGPRVIVDYAHSPEALAVALDALRASTQGQLRVVFGAGGDRDRLKRPLMGEAAAKAADWLYLTTDNPRGEAPAAIAAEVRAGIPNDVGSLVIELDRAAAIQRAIGEAKADDTLLIAGKGHENYQVLAHETIHFDDREVARSALGNWRAR